MCICLSISLPLALSIPPSILLFPSSLPRVLVKMAMKVEAPTWLRARAREEASAEEGRPVKSQAVAVAKAMAVAKAIVVV